MGLFRPAEMVQYLVIPRGLRKARQGRGASAGDNTHHRKRHQGRHGMSSHLERLDRRPGRMSTPTFLSDPANQGEIRGEILQPANRPHRVIRDLGPLTRAALRLPATQWLEPPPRHGPPARRLDAAHGGPRRRSLRIPRYHYIPRSASLYRGPSRNPALGKTTGAKPLGPCPPRFHGSLRNLKD